MSLFNSVTGSKGQEQGKTTLGHPQSKPTKEAKRKAEESSGPYAKSMKTNSSNRAATAPNASSAPSSTGEKRQAHGAPEQQQMPYRGTSNLASSTPSLAPAEGAPKPPKKGSYKEIMARAQAAAAAQPKAAIGSISHKPRSKLEMSFKQEQKMKKKALRDKKLGVTKGENRPSSSDGRGSGDIPGKPVKKRAPQPTYTGTAKPRPQPSYKGTMGTAPSVKKASAKPPPKRNTNEYAATDDELESDDAGEDDGQGYSEEDSDDMEAGFSDVEQEESLALRSARKEDEEEARLEARLKKEKEDRRKRLELMAKKAKPPRY
ncbi:MAG: hypothetical protein OHK93_002572 [Ramalina farinacea]|uniref:Uncharacterized protein n=1 Tax=Ramalina farinacea TaxID=258253 RepID=A0AA43QUY4_9LECA|nr:hypothetical protein [Ramalina farinacea]